MATVIDIISRSLRLIGVGESGFDISADSAQLGLESLNSMLDAWSIERLNIYNISDYEFELVPGTASYTLGPTGNTTPTVGSGRPLRIDGASLRVYNQDPELELQLEIVDDEQFDTIRQKTLTSTEPLYVFPAHTFPNETITLWPVPTLAHTLILNVWTKLTSFTATTDTFTFPPGYERAIVYNLAVELAPEFKVDAIPAAVVQTAASSKRAIKAFNQVPTRPSIDPFLVAGNGGGWDWRTGGVR